LRLVLQTFTLSPVTYHGGADESRLLWKGVVYEAHRELLSVVALMVVMLGVAVATAAIAQGEQREVACRHAPLDNPQAVPFCERTT
jgi:hypothetical protein